MKILGLVLAWAPMALAGGSRLPEAPQSVSPFANPLAAEDLDPAAFAQWVDGAEKPFGLRDGPRHVIWTRNPRGLGRERER